ncbi:hypothetical protein V8F20_005249 [Naviculisporaceae sp. PSN 640]
MTILLLYILSQLALCFGFVNDGVCVGIWLSCHGLTPQGTRSSGIRDRRVCRLYYPPGRDVSNPSPVSQGGIQSRGTFDNKPFRSGPGWNLWIRSPLGKAPSRGPNGR